MVFLIITIYWFYRGLRRGLYPALNILFVFFVPLLITLNYYDLLFGVVAKIKPDTTQSAREAISFVATYLITFFICVYFCLWLCAEELRMDKTIDTIAGGILGIVTGMICCGVLMLIWFSTSFSRLPQFEVSDTDMFYKPQDYALAAATIVADRVKGEREFSGERFLRDLRYGLPQVPTLGAGFYISSVPTGLKVFIEPGGGSPAALLVKIKERLNNPERDVPPSEQREVQVEKGRTPLFLHENSATALIAVVMESVPADLAQVAADEPDRLFRSDGEVGYAKETLGDRTLYIKFYKVDKAGGPVGSEIALFQPRDMTKYAKEFEDFWPSKTCFRFNDGQVEMQMRDMGATQDEAKAILQDNQLRMCGKVIFVGTEGKVYGLELSSTTQPARIFEVQPATDVNTQVHTVPGR
ncbi:MAG: CvpA family protein [Candidatus Brocadiia bacterium]